MRVVRDHLGYWEFDYLLQWHGAIAREAFVLRRHFARPVGESPGRICHHGGELVPPNIQEVVRRRAWRWLVEGLGIPHVRRVVLATCHCYCSLENLRYLMSPFR